MPRRSEYNVAGFRRLLDSQHRVIARSQAIECGLPVTSIDKRLMGGERWQWMLPGVYLTQSGKPTADQRDMAALLYAGSQSVITGPVAIRRHRLRSPGPDTVDVLVPWDRKRQSFGFVRIHRTRRMPEYHATGQIRFAIPARAVADAARGFSSLDDVRTVVAEAIQKRSCSLADIRGELNDGATRHSRFLRVALAEVSDGVRSVAEARFRMLIARSDLPRPLYNACLYTVAEEFVAQVDAWWAEAGVSAEVDSQEYHFYRTDWLATQARRGRMQKHLIIPHHFAPSRIQTDWPAIYDELKSSIAGGCRRPRLPIIARPALSEPTARAPLPSTRMSAAPTPT